MQTTENEFERRPHPLRDSKKGRKVAVAAEKSISAVVGTCGVRRYPLSGSHMMGATESDVGESACLSPRCARASCHLVARACAYRRGWSWTSLNSARVAPGTCPQCAGSMRGMGLRHGMCTI